MRESFVAMNMMNKCAKFHKDSPSDKRVKFTLPSAIELSETAFFGVQLCIETLHRRATSVAHLTKFSFEIFYEIFTKNASPLFLYYGVKKSKMTKNSNQGARALKTALLLVSLATLEQKRRPRFAEISSFPTRGHSLKSA